LKKRVEERKRSVAATGAVKTDTVVRVVYPKGSEGEAAMKWKILFCLPVFLIPIGCWYDAPLTEERALEVDPAVLGWWECVSEDTADAEESERMLVMRFSETEYLVHYLVGQKETFYFRAYPIEIGGVACVQLQIIGFADGAADQDEKPFYAASYNLAGGELVVKLLNRDLIDEGLTGSEALRRAFLKHKDNPELFRDPGRFRRVKRSKG